ncbi:MAG: DUF167 domain-containing protein [Holosporales bacterium]
MRVVLRVTPKASTNAILGWQVQPDGSRVLKVSVTAVPEKGQANEDLIRFLSKVWRLPKRAFRLVQGASSRTKIMEVEGLSEEVLCL